MILIRLLVVTVTLVALHLCTGGCSARVGSKTSNTAAAAIYENGSPNVLTLSRGDETWSINNSGPAKYTEQTAGGTVSIEHGSIGNKFYYDRESGRFVVDSGADITAEGIEVDPGTGRVSIARFATTGTDQIKAGNEAYDRLVTYWASRDDASKAAIIAELETIKEVAPTAAGVLTSLIETIAGIK